MGDDVKCRTQNAHLPCITSRHPDITSIQHSRMHSVVFTCFAGRFPGMWAKVVVSGDKSDLRT